jgi:hypothetical protein
MKISIPIAWYKDPEPIVEGEIIDVPHLAMVATFIVHKAAPEDWHNWKVTNVETGASVASGATRGKAIALALKKLENRDQESILKSYKIFNKSWSQYRRRNGAA